MSTVCFFVPDDRAPGQSHLVVYCSSEHTNASDIATAMQAALDQRPRSLPERTYFLTPEPFLKAIQDVVDEPAVKDKVAQVGSRTPPEVVAFDDQGRLSASIGGNDHSSVSTHAVRHLIESCGGILLGDSAFHYVTPDRIHVDKFLNLGATLTHAAHASLAAFAVLCHARNPTPRILVDTAAILPIAQELRFLWSLFKSKPNDVRIESFSSHRRVDAYPFDDHETTTIVSYSSGRLMKRLSERVGPGRQGCVILGYSDEIHTWPVICNLGTGSASPNAPTGYAEPDCPMCRKGSRPIDVSREHFFPTPTAAATVMLTLQHSPKGLNTFMAELIGRDMCRVFYDDSDASTEPQEVYFDLEEHFTPLTEEGESGDHHATFARRMDAVLARSVPAATKRVITLDDPASIAMGKKIVASFKERPPELIALGAMTSKLPLVDGASVVVAGVVRSGRRLRHASQRLRSLQKNGGIVYIIGLLRCESKHDRTRLIADLSMGESPGDYPVAVGRSVNLPAHQRHYQTAWHLEAKVLNEILANSDLRIQDRAESVLKSRLRSLNEASSESRRGLLNDVFWPDPNGHPLRIRENFAFFQGISWDAESVTQADVVATISAILHRARCERVGAQQRLQQSTFYRTVLDPGVFERYNDGVIQAAILRTALPAELDYSISPTLSASMTHVLRRRFASVGTSDGEAALEFALALAIGRIRIRADDLTNLAATLPNSLSQTVAPLFLHIATKL